MIDYAGFDDTLLVTVCERFLGEHKVIDIVEWLQEEHGVAIKRENIYPLLREARKRGYLSVHPPPDGLLRQRICDRFDQKKDNVPLLVEAIADPLSKQAIRRGVHREKDSITGLP